VIKEYITLIGKIKMKIETNSKRKRKHALSVFIGDRCFKLYASLTPQKNDKRGGWGSETARFAFPPAPPLLTLLLIYFSGIGLDKTKLVSKSDN
jgi:hypothetical protein